MLSEPVNQCGPAMLTTLFHQDQHRYTPTDLDISCPPHQPLWVSNEPFATNYIIQPTRIQRTRDDEKSTPYIRPVHRRNHECASEKKEKTKTRVRDEILKKESSDIIAFLRIHYPTYLFFLHRTLGLPHYLQQSMFQTSAHNS